MRKGNYASYNRRKLTTGLCKARVRWFTPWERAIRPRVPCASIATKQPIEIDYSPPEAIKLLPLLSLLFVTTTV